MQAGVIPDTAILVILSLWPGQRKRMKFRKFGQRSLASAVLFGLGLGITACGPSNTVDFVYVTGSKNNPGQIEVYEADSESGALTPIQAAIYPSGGRNPIAEVTSPNYKYLYVLNHDDNALVQFAIGTDGKLYPQNTYNTPGTEPSALSINKAGTFLFVTDTFQPGFTSANPGAGAVVVYPISSDGSLGTPVTQTFTSAGKSISAPYYPVCYSPSGVNVLANGNDVYVVNTNNVSISNSNRCLQNVGTVSAFNVSSSGVLAPITGNESDGTFAAGVFPTAIASDPGSNWIYVTDAKSNELIGYNIASNGFLTAMQNGPFKTGNYPVGVVVDPRGEFIYVSNYTDNTVSAFAISLSSGNPSQVSGSGTYSTDTGPTCVIVDPAIGRFVYTANFLDSTVSGLQLNPNTGALTTNQNSPYPGPGQSTCVAAIPHGNHSIQTNLD
jgi:6-phosphogluconolactonase